MKATCFYKERQGEYKRSIEHKIFFCTCINLMSVTEGVEPNALRVRVLRLAAELYATVKPHVFDFFSLSKIVLE